MGSRRRIGSGGRRVLLLAVVASSVACASWPGKRSPRLDKPRNFPRVDGPVAIRLRVDDRSAEPRPERIARALDLSRQKFAFLSQATYGTADPDYIIDLAVDYSYRAGDFNALSYYSFLLFPAFFTEQVSVVASVATSDDDVLGIVHSTGRRKIALQMHLLWVLPVATPLMPHVERKMWNNTFRDVFIQAGDLIAAEQRRLVRTSYSSVDRPSVRVR